ncbi:hypothetical protein EHW65_08155 [Erwinia psidii]|uniref:ADP-ribosyltransferase n=1 Tax=Erwinia psidii TaxID=69224 RepID=UPI00226B6F42|nr:ADP-ribosyltransferase [Erwinia psidii]MCX8957243.1 hypothetical protein [Erwinia psidii]
MISLENSSLALYIKSRIFKSTESAVELAKKNHSPTDIKFAMKLLQIKNSSNNPKLNHIVKYEKNEMKRSEKYDIFLGKISKISNLVNSAELSDIEKKYNSSSVHSVEFISKESMKLSNDLIEHFGLEAEQYLSVPLVGVPDGEKLAMGLYTNGSYVGLNKALRNNEEMNKGDSLIHSGMSSYFYMHTNNKLIKTFRGTDSRDAFSDISENSSGHDAGYLSTSKKLDVATLFSKGDDFPAKNSDRNISIVFGNSGLDVSELSIEGEDEDEILYKSNTEMDVLFAEVDKHGVNKRVLHESSLPSVTGKQERLIAALDLASAKKAGTSTKMPK